VLCAGQALVPLNTCYVTMCRDEDDAFALAALVNSPVAAAWLDALAEPARGGYRRFLGWTMALLPVPQRWEEARVQLAGVGRRATRNPECVTENELTRATLRAFGLRARDVAPLIAWGHR
jgi:hypothetical protein